MEYNQLCRRSVLVSCFLFFARERRDQMLDFHKRGDAAASSPVHVDKSQGSDLCLRFINRTMKTRSGGIMIDG